MKCKKEWYECDYCGTEVDGETNISDDFTTSGDTTDICSKQECIDIHSENVRKELLENNNHLYWILDSLSDEYLYEYETKGDKYKIKWNESDNWHTYIRKTLVEKIMPIYESDYLHLDKKTNKRADV